MIRWVSGSVAAVTLVALIVLAAVKFIGGSARQEKADDTDLSAEVEVSSNRSPDKWEQYFDEGSMDLERRQAQVVVLDPATNTWFTQSVSLTIPAHQSGRIRAVVGEWISITRREGEMPLVPRDTELLSAYVDSNRRIYLNFSSDLTAKFEGGATTEIQFLTSLAMTLYANFPNYAEMQLMVEGASIETLGGQIDVSAPLRIAFFAERG
ncbi:MAG: GerMN domain-containing protein [Candidatus Poribacteria bacterium]|nr:GerMN domain-containing protein [Candidatus Poribacteria bacterium]